MGREIRRVPPDWLHPKERRYDLCSRSMVSSYIPLFDQTLEEAQTEWDERKADWDAGRDDHAKRRWDESITFDDGTSIEKGALIWTSMEEFYGPRPAELYPEIDEDGNPSDLAGCYQPYRRRAWTPGEATAFQVYETVSEGTPTSPVFGTADSLVAWLVENGHSRHAAEKFVHAGSAPSMVIAGGVLAQGIDTFDMDVVA